MSKEFSGKVIIITGASSPKGIGTEAARQFANMGAEAIVISSREHSEKKAMELVSELENLGTKALWVAGDISDPETPKKIIQQTLNSFKRIDVLINNAGIRIDKPINAISAEDWDAVLNTNLRSTYLMIRESIMGFSKQDGGSIINIASIVGKFGNTGQANYAAAKAGIIGLTKSAAIDLGRRNIRVNAILPGFVATDITSDIPENVRESIIAATPLGRFGSPKDIANLIIFLASSKSAFITGQEMIIDGGLGGGIIGIAGMMRAGYKK